MALVDERTLVIGDMESVTAAIDHHIAEDANQASDPLYQRASELSADNAIWGGWLMPPRTTSPARAPNRRRF